MSDIPKVLPAFVCIPLVAAFLLPIFGSFGRKGSALATAIANLATVSLLAMSIASINRFSVYNIGKWSIPLGINMVLDGLTILFLITVNLVSTAAMLFSVRYMEQYTAKPKYLSLFMLMVAGMNGVVLTGDLFNLFVFLEIASIASYALVGFGCDDEQLEASFKYAVLGGIASLLILFGIGLIYGATGMLNMAYISKAIQKDPTNVVLCFTLALFIAGFGLKAALVPFHSWLPDAHSSAPAPISAMLSGILIKVLGVYAIVRIVFSVFGISSAVGTLLAVLGVVNMIAGAFLAIGQEDLKRLLAYSSISQVGYIFLGIGLGGTMLAAGTNPVWASLAILGGLFHLLNHAVSKSLLFLTSGSVEMAAGTRQLSQLGGLAEKLPLTRAGCAIASASIVGIPPFGGFWSKLILVIAAIGAGVYWAAALIVAVSVCTLIMYLKVHRYVFLGQLSEARQQIKENRGSMAVAMICLACLCVFIGLVFLVPSLRAAVLEPAAKVLSDGVAYADKIIEVSKGMLVCAD
jgi:multicomponent Na+:H+ antiporter subunit D